MYIEQWKSEVEPPARGQFQADVWHKNERPVVCSLHTNPMVNSGTNSTIFLYRFVIKNQLVHVVPNQRSSGHLSSFQPTLTALFE